MPDLDIRLSVEFFDDLKVIKLKRRLGPEGVLSLIGLWLWAAKNRPSGELTELSHEEIAKLSLWRGHTLVFLEVLTDLEFIQQKNGKIKICDWNRQQPHLKKFTHTKRLSTSLWKKIKKGIFDRDSNRCVYCGAVGEQMHCDHIVPLSRGGDNSISNLATSCPDCNLRKGSKTLQEWRGYKCDLGI